MSALSFYRERRKEGKEKVENVRVPPPPVFSVATESKVLCLHALLYVSIPNETDSGRNNVARFGKSGAGDFE